MPDQATDNVLPITLLLVDDNAFVGAALQRWFSRSPDFRWAGWLATPDAIDDVITKQAPGVVLLDWDMPGANTAALLVRLSAAFPRVIFAVISGHMEAVIITAALKAGARGYLSKGQGPADLAAEVRLLATGQIVLSADAHEALQQDRNAVA